MKANRFAPCAALFLGLGIGLLGCGRAEAADKNMQQHHRLAAYSNTDDGTQHVVHLTDAGDIIQFAGKEDGEQGWTKHNLTQLASAPKAERGLAAWYTPYDKTQHVFFVTKEGQIGELGFNANQRKWVFNDLSKMTKAAAVEGNLCGYPARDVNSQFLVFRNKEGNLFELVHRKDDARGWVLNDLMKLAPGAPPAAGDVSTYFLNDDDSQHIVYRDKEGQLNELFFIAKQGKWSQNNLSTATKAPKAASDPHGFAHQSDDSQHIVFRAEDGAVIELVAKKGDKRGWTLNNLTSAGAAPMAAGRPVGCVVSDDKLLKRSHLRVLYRDQEGQLHELAWAHDQNKWTHNNLTMQAKAPKAASDPFCYGFKDREHVVFFTDDQKLIELYYVDDKDNRGWHMTNLTAAAK